MSNKDEGQRPLEHAVFLLLDRLQDAANLEGRSAAIESLLAIADFLSVISGPGEHSHQRPINELTSALISLDDGKVLPLLKPARRAGNPPNPIALESAKGAAAFVVRRLCDAGMDAGDAYGKVAVVCRQAGLRGRAGGMTARTVRGWAEAIQKDVHCRTRAERQYASLMSALPVLHGPVEPGKLLDSLRRFLGGKR